MDYMPSERPSWPATMVCRTVPVALVTVAVLVPGLCWSTLPANRPGPLIVPTVLGAIALLALLPDVWRPKGWTPASYEGPVYTGGLSGIIMGWLRARFGPVAAKVFILASATGIAVATTIGSTGSKRWSLPWPGILASALGAITIALLSGIVVREYGRLIDSRTLKPSKLPRPRPDYSSYDA